jgi:hypothetical protein
VPPSNDRTSSYFAAGDGLALGAGEAFFVEDDLVVVAAGLATAAGLAAGAGLATVLCALCFFEVFAAAGLGLAVGVSANATIGIAAQASSRISFFMSLIPLLRVA